MTAEGAESAGGMDDRAARRHARSTRAFVLAFAIVEAAVIAWFLLGDVRARAARRAAAAAASQTPATRSAPP